MNLVRYAFIDALPDVLLDAVVANPHGMLRPRAEAITVLRDALLGGALPDRRALPWPEPSVRDALLDGLARSGVVEHCAANPTITHEVLASLLAATGEAQRRVDELLAQWTLAAREHARRHRPVGMIAEPNGTGDALIDEETWRRIRDDAAALAGAVALEALQPKLDEWTGQGRERSEIRAILEALAAASGSKFAVAGYLASIDWRTSTELRRLLAHVPALRTLVRKLGRHRAPDEPTRERGLETRGRRVARPTRVEAAAVHELDRVEIRGIERSNEIARMLASEAVLRRSPVTKLLWHARRAEHGLLAYHAESVARDTALTEQHFCDGATTEHARAERGPIIVILDTSGSMQGFGETLAKAVVLQVVCIAELEQRACYVYNFSGPGDLVEHELALAGDGLARALAFLTLTFGGATNISEALRRALQRLETERWIDADILIVTDGLLDDPSEPFDRTTLRLLDRARRRRPFQLHVALVPPEPTTDRYPDDRWVVRELADHVHDIQAWIDGFGPDN